MILGAGLLATSRRFRDGSMASPTPSPIWLDWVRAREGSGREFVTRSFTPAMGLKAATQASQEWHEAVATNADCRQGRELPAPWYPAAKQGGFDIIPIATAADLYREGQAMHHCVATYADRVREGACYVFSVRQSGERVATVSLVRDGAQVLIEQVRGPCNNTPTHSDHDGVAAMASHATGAGNSTTGSTIGRA